MLHVVLLALALAAPSPDLPGLLGLTTAQLDAKLGVPQVFTIEAETLGPVTASRGYALPDGGSLDVRLCDGAAFGFTVHAGAAHASAEALLAAAEDGENAVFYLDGRRLGRGTPLDAIDPEALTSLTVFRCADLVDDPTLRGIVVMATEG